MVLDECLIREEETWFRRAKAIDEVLPKQAASSRRSAPSRVRPDGAPEHSRCEQRGVRGWTLGS